MRHGEMGSAVWAKFHSKGHVVAFLRRGFGFGRFRGGGCGRRGSARRGRGTTFTGAWTTQELNDLSDDTELAALLTGLLVIPLVETQPPFDQHRAALAHVLRNIFRRAPENIDVNKSDFLFLLAALARP